MYAALFDDHLHELTGAKRNLVGMALAASQLAFDWLPRFKRTRILLPLDDGVGTSAALSEQPWRRRKGPRHGSHGQEQTEQESETVMSSLRAKPEWCRVTCDVVVHSVSYICQLKLLPLKVALPSTLRSSPLTEVLARLAVAPVRGRPLRAHR